MFANTLKTQNTTGNYPVSAERVPNSELFLTTRNQTLPEVRRAEIEQVLEDAMGGKAKSIIIHARNQKFDPYIDVDNTPLNSAITEVGAILPPGAQFSFFLINIHEFISDKSAYRSRRTSKSRQLAVHEIKSLARLAYPKRHLDVPVAKTFDWSFVLDAAIAEFNDDAKEKILYIEIPEDLRTGLTHANKTQGVIVLKTVYHGVYAMLAVTPVGKKLELHPILGFDVNELRMNGKK